MVGKFASARQNYRLVGFHFHSAWVVSSDDDILGLEFAMNMQIILTNACLKFMKAIFIINSLQFKSIQFFLIN